MSTTESFKLSHYSERLVDALLDDAKRHGLVLFVGSGINGTAIDQWNKLLGKLLKKALEQVSLQDIRFKSEDLQEWCMRTFDLCAQATIVKSILGAELYRVAVQDVLYPGCPELEQQVKDYCADRMKDQSSAPPKGDENADRFEYLYQAAQLCSSPAVRAVATFNFDTLLECAINACSKTKFAQAYYGDGPAPAVKQSQDEEKMQILSVYHLHGRISSPRGLLRNPRESVVFSYDEYFDKNADSLSWETSTPLHLLRNFCTLWVGASLKDWNMMRLLDASRSGRDGVNSYCLQSMQEGGTDRSVQPAAMRLQATLCEAVGIKLITGGQDYADLWQTLALQITQKLPKEQQTSHSSQ